MLGNIKPDDPLRQFLVHGTHTAALWANTVQMLSWVGVIVGDTTRHDTTHTAHD